MCAMVALFTIAKADICLSAASYFSIIINSMGRHKETQIDTADVCSAL